MGQKSKKKNSTGSASKLKKSDEIALFVALPPVSEDGSAPPCTEKNVGAVSAENVGATDPNLNSSKVSNQDDGKVAEVDVAPISSNPNVLTAAQVPPCITSSIPGHLTDAPTEKQTISEKNDSGTSAEDVSTLVASSVTLGDGNLKDKSTNSVVLPDTPNVDPVVVTGNDVSTPNPPSSTGLIVAADNTPGVEAGDKDDMVSNEAVGFSSCVPINVDEIGAGGAVSGTETGTSSKAPSGTAALPKAPYAPPNYGYVGDDVGKTNDGGKAPWLNLFGDNREITKGFKLQEDLSKVKPNAVSFKDMDIEEDDFGKLSLVGYFASRHPGKDGYRKWLIPGLLNASFFNIPLDGLYSTFRMSMTETKF